MNVRTIWFAGASTALLALPAMLASPAATGTQAAPAPQEKTAKALEHGEQVKVDSTIPEYKSVAGISGNLNSVGSDTLSGCMTLWAAGFTGQYPNVHVQTESKGSGSAPPALTAGTSQIGPMSREMKKTEQDEFEAKYGYPPTKIRVAIDALAVFVNKDNPIEKLTLAQVDAIFSKQRKAGFAKDVINWGDLGLAGEWAQRPISLYGRNSASGTYGFFKEHVLKNGDYKDTVKEQPGSGGVVQGVSEDKSGVGYSGIGYRTSSVRAVPLALDDKSEAPAVDASSVYSGKYPITRFLYVYVNRAPKQPLDPLVKEFITYVLSQQGQGAVLKDGYFPLTPKVVTDELKLIQ